LYIFTETVPYVAMDGKTWAQISRNAKNLIKALPFIDDPTFIKLKPAYQRFILAYTFRDVKKWTLADCYRFARRDMKMSAGTAYNGKYRYANHPTIKPYLDRIDWMRVEVMGYNAQRIIEEELALGFSDITEYLDERGDALCPVNKLKDLPTHVKRAIRSVEVVVDSQGNRNYKLKLWDKGQSLARLEKIRGMHKENINLTGAVAQVNIDENTDPVEASRLYMQMIKGIREEND
jgi:hypothetical protein